MKSKRYYKMIKHRVIFLVIILLVVCVSFNASYSNFIYNSNNHRAVEIYVSSLLYDFKVNDAYTDTITVKPGNTYVSTSITSLNEVNTKFKLIYKDNEDLRVFYLNGNPADEIAPNETKKYNFLVSNLSDDIIKLEFKVNSGYNTHHVEDIKVDTGYNEIVDTIKVGDYVAYTPVNSNDSYVLKKELSGYTKDQTIVRKSSKWKVFNINTDGSVDLISEKAITLDSKNNLLHLSGYKGYNNGVYIINELCNKVYGSYFALGRSLNVDDIESKLTKLWKPSEYVDYGNENNHAEFSTNTFVPAVYLSHLSKSDKGSLITEDEINEEDSLDINIDYWTKEFEKENFVEPFFDMFMNQKYPTWLASRYIGAFESYALFGIHNIEGKTVSGNLLYSSRNDTFTNNNALRPIVNLKAPIYKEKNTYKIKILD